MRDAEGEAVLILVKKRVLGLRTLRNKADAAGSARPEGKNAGSFETKLGKPNRKWVYHRYSRYRLSYYGEQ